MRTVALVHGAWHGSWCWAMVLAGLDDRGVPTITVDLPGPDLFADADHVRTALDGIDGPVVLVGHSYGGAVVSDAGTHPAVEQLVYVCALVPDIGETVAAIGVEGGVGDLEAIVQISDDGMATIDLDLAEAAFYADCHPVDVARARELLRPQPFACLTQPARTAAWRQRPSTYVVCGEDRAVPPAFQRGMAARIPGAAVVELPESSHSPFLSHPGELVDLLAGLAGDA